MSVAEVPDAFDEMLNLEARLWDDLKALHEKTQRSISVSGQTPVDVIRGSFLRWFLLEGIPSADLPITNVTIEQATIADVLDLEGTTIDLLLGLIQCKFENSIKLSDATIQGLTVIGGSVREIVADRLTVKGSMRLYQRDYSQPDQRPHIGKLRLCGAEIRGNLDMRGCIIEPFPKKNCQQQGKPGAALQLESQKGANSQKQDSPPLFADGLIVHGNALLSGGFSSVGEIRLNGCTIDRNLDCSGADLSCAGGYSLSAAGAHVKGSAYFSRTAPWSTYPKSYSFKSTGTLRLDGAEINGDLDCTGGSFFATAFSREQQQNPLQKDLYAISADGIKVGADIRFDPDEDKNERFAAHGMVSLISAHIGGDFNCRQAEFDFSGEEPLIADGIVVEGTTFFEKSTSNGTLRFVLANLKQGFYLSEAKFETGGGCRSWTEKEDSAAALELGGPSCGIYAPNAQISGTFLWEKVEKTTDGNLKPNSFSLFILGAKADRIEDDEMSWSALDLFEVMGCEYGSFVKLSDADTKWRLRELDRQYAKINIMSGKPDLALAWMRIRRRLSCRLSPKELESISDQLDDTVRKFKPQPYVELAKTFRAAGYEAAARNVLVRLERNKTRCSGFAFWHQFWRYSLDIFLRYGYAPFRPVVYVLLWAIVSAVVFHNGYGAEQILPSKDNQAGEMSTSKLIPPLVNPTPDPPVAFNSIVYAVDTLVPIVDLNQKKNWTISTARAGTSGLALLLIFNTFFGWLMTTLFAAGVTGLLRTGEDI